MPWSGASRQARGYGRAWELLRERVLERDSHLCQACARKDRVAMGREVHHITPKAKGGTDDDTNLETLCRDCHVEADAIAFRPANRRYRVALDGTIIDE